MWPNQHKYDAFISHAVEDKIAVANELCARLEAAGLKIWYSGKELMVGDSLEKTIPRGLDRSRYGVVILSPTYLRKNWTMREFNLLLDKEIEHRTVILPVLYDLTMEDLLERNMIMADKWALPIDKGMDFVVEKLLSVMKAPPNKPRTVFEWLEENWYALRFWLFVLAIVVLGTVLAVYISRQYPSDALIVNIIANHISEVNASTVVGSKPTEALTPRLSSLDTTAAIHGKFVALSSSYRNEYEFFNGVSRIRTRKHVEAALRRDLSSLLPSNSYGFSDPMIYSFKSDSSSGIKSLRYSFVNSKPLSFHIESERSLSDGEYEVIVSYQENIREILVNLTYPTASVPTKRHLMKIVGLKPTERILLQKIGSDWVLKSIE